MPPSNFTLPYGTLPKDYVNLGTIIGPFFLAQCLNWCLYGILCLQVYVYSLRFPKDLIGIKSLVAVIFVLDSFSIALVTHSAWQVLVSRWGDVNVLNDLDWTWASVPVSSGVISALVQMFFVWRIWKLTQSHIMPVIITLVILTQSGFAIRTGFIAAEIKTFHYIRDLIPGFWLGGSMLADILISATLGQFFWASRTGFSETDSTIMRLMRLTIEAAVVPTIAAGTKLALIYSEHENEHLIFCVVLARLYSNSLLAMLNARDGLFGGGIKRNPQTDATRLSDTGNKTLLRHLVDKFSTRSRGSVNTQDTYITRNSESHYTTPSSIRNKIRVRQASAQHALAPVDVDLESAVELEYCPSQAILNSPFDSTKPAQTPKDGYHAQFSPPHPDAFPTSPVTSASPQSAKGLHD